VWAVAGRGHIWISLQTTLPCGLCRAIVSQIMPPASKCLRMRTPSSRSFTSCDATMLRPENLRALMNLSLDFKAANDSAGGSDHQPVCGACALVLHRRGGQRRSVENQQADPDRFLGGLV